jgi:outer membrane protein assembly factor BamE
MGTPLIQDSFHGNRWDYVYQMREKGKVIEQRRVILDFENELLKTVRGDVIPAVSDKAGDAANNSGTRVINPTAKPEEKGMLSKLKFWEKDEATLAKEAADAKAKAEADEAAKKAAAIAKDKVENESAVPVEEKKSILAVPLEVLPAAEVPASEVRREAAPVAEPIPVIETPKVEQSAVDLSPVVEPITAVESTLEVQARVQPLEEVTPAKIKATAVMPVQNTVEKAAVVVKEPMSIVPVSYDSLSGMKFDRSLRLADGIEPTVAPEVSAPRAGNKTVPKPKELPAESKPGFFDRMLEKIGF